MGTPPFPLGGGMEVLFQIPIIDLRGIVGPDTGRRSRPTWPTGRVATRPGAGEFVPGFGALRKTPGSQTGGWEARAQNVAAARALRFPDNLGSYYRALTSPHSFAPLWRSLSQCAAISR